ncbi:MAG: radical SAM family heme chaperone HemW, partial [Cytophagales bacterium]|nr:radical SAM family heme chaperone HemW [Cytophagales bacterium]
MSSLYIHIPFCHKACHYCDFHFSTNFDLKTELVTCISREIVQKRDFLSNKKLKTIYLGGGTPSVLTIEELNTLFHTIRNNFDIENDAEITLEANPDDLTIEKLSNLKKLGINRLSIGIQSFDDKELQLMNRNHSSEQGRKCVENTRAVGFDNINIDLIYSVPYSTLESLREKVHMALSFKPEHISAYCMTVEDGTAFGHWLKNGKLIELEDNDSFSQYLTLIEILESNGLEQYEISNFSRKGFESKHNSTYWEIKEYLGVGPSAHSFNGEIRYSNVSNNPAYIQGIKNGQNISEIENLTAFEKANEYIMTGLRKNSGLNCVELNNRFGYDILTEKSKEFEILHSSQLA